MTLQSAVGFSATIHLLLLTAAPSGAWLAPRQKRFEVSYIPARPSPAPVAVVKPQPVVPIAQPRLPNPVPEASPRGSDPIKGARINPGTLPLRQTPSGFKPPAAPPAISRPVTRDDVAVPAPRPAISSLPDKEFVFLDHKEQVRKHLKARLNYPATLSDGTVRLRVILGPEGSFKQAVVLETSDPRLAGLAVRDAQAAAPYPRLPAKFRPRQLRYEFLVRYRPE